MTILDCSGMLCPKPLIETKKAIKSGKPGDDLKIIIDNDTSLQNLNKFLIDNGIKPIYANEKGKHSLIFTISNLNDTYKPEDYCEVSTPQNHAGKYIVVLESDSMGSGDKELGDLLAKGFLSTIADLDTLPQEIICYNGGVKLAKKGTPSASNLVKLNQLGVKIMLCGTCVDFYKIKDEIEIGEISNMYYIASRLTSGANIVKPF